MEFHGRMSNDSSDRGYANWVPYQHEASRVKIYLNDVLQKYVAVADTLEGLVKRAKLDEDGELYVVAGRVAEEVVTGKVRIVVTDK